MTNTETPAASRKDIKLIIIITAASLAHWTILILGIPALDSLPYWKFLLREIPIHSGWILIAFTAIALATAVTLSRLKTALKLFLLILLGAAMQFSFVYSKGHGLDSFRSRLLNIGGHAEFAKYAVRHPNLLNAARDYEELAKSEAYNFIPSKPPGTLIFYIINGRIANFNKGDIKPDERAENLAAFASFTWPFLTYLLLIPLYFLARILYDDTVAITACLLYLPIPSINLIVAHTDQVIYPTLAIIPILLIVLAFQKESIWLAAASGVAFYTAVYFSFGLAAIGFFYLLPVIAPSAQSWRERFWISSKLLGVTALSAAICDILARALLNYDILLRYTNALRHHAEWKSWENNLDTLLKSSVTNSIEFSVWIGIPLTVILAAAAIHAFRQLAVKREPNTSAIFPALLFGIFFYLLAFGKTKAETARLWIFLIPPICIIAADFINPKTSGGKNQKLLLLLLVFYEFTTTYLTIHYQDFR